MSRKALLQKYCNDKQTAIYKLDKMRSEYRIAAIDSRVDPLLRQVADERARIDEEVEGLYGDAMRALMLDLDKGAEELDAFLVEERTKDTGWLPVGTLVRRWENNSGLYKTRNKDMFSTGAVGVVEVWGPESKRPANRRAWSEPVIGEVIVRMLKKDGKTGLHYERPVHYNKIMWYANGVDPNTPGVKTTEEYKA